MHSSRGKLLLGALLSLILLFSIVNAHGDHGHRHKHQPVADDLEDDAFASPPDPEPTPVKSIELPTFTVIPFMTTAHCSQRP